MQLLGLSFNYHDAAACLYRDGRVIAAAEQERFSRAKHDSTFPTDAARCVLDLGGTTIADIDYVVYYEKPLVKFERILAAAVQEFPRTLDYFVPAMQAWLGRKLWVPSEIRQTLKYRGPILYADHHMSHAASGYYSSPFENAAVITADGVGEWATTTVGHGVGSSLRIKKEIHFPLSLGLLYSAFTAYLGFEVNEGEYKVMGMAAYGRPNYVEEVRRILKTFDDGSYTLDLRYLGFQRGTQAWSRAFERLFGPPCEPAEGAVDQRCADIAASIQAVTEEAVLGLANEAYRLTGVRDLCLAGGVALNVLANRRLLVETPFERVYVPPSPGDSGGAIGAAAYAYHHVLGKPRVAGLADAYLGPAYDDAAIAAFLASRGIAHRELSRAELPLVAARSLAAGRVIGWFQGRMEFGPRALGHRSILADPGKERMKDIINAVVKHREPFRPFAPSVTREDAHRFFETVPESPFMSFVARVRPEARTALPAVTHEDGTARLQTVDRDSEPLYHEVLKAFERLSGYPVVVNTSFNVRGEPIVCTPLDAYVSFSHTDMDELFLGRFVVDRAAKSTIEPYPGRASIRRSSSGALLA